MAQWPWLTKQAHNVRRVISNQKSTKAKSGLKIINYGREMNMDFKRTKNGGITKVLDDFRVSNIGKSIKAIIAEYNHTIIKHAPFNSTYEGWALIRQKVDVLWEEIKKDETENSRTVMLKEAAQIGAMAMRFIIDIGMEDKLTKMSPIDNKKVQ